MNRRLTALFAALEAALAVGLGLGLLIVPLTFMWAFQYDLQVEWPVFYRAAADIWLLGHSVDLRIAAELPGLAEASEPFHATIGLLGVGLVTALLGVRSGRRLLETDHPAIALVATLVVFAGLSMVVTLTAASSVALPSRPQGVILPTLIFAAGVAFGAVVPGSYTRRRPPSPRSGVATRASDFVSDTVPEEIVAGIAWSLRIGGMVTAGLFAVSAVLVAFLFAVGYTTVIGIYESLQAGVLGGAAITIGQLALLPNLITWTAAWLVGPGFAIGEGSSISPLGTSVGPVPSLPVFGAIPTAELPFGFVGLAVPVVIAFLAGALLRQRIGRSPVGPSTRATLAIGAGSGVTAGILLGLLVWASSGAAGPGRLASVGANPLLVGAIAALEVGIAATLGLLAAGRRSNEDNRADEWSEATR